MPEDRTPREVVGVAIIRAGEVLAAQRAYPAEHEGRWELPGGKVADGELLDDAAVREIAEELGVEVTITGRLTENARITDHLQLVAVTAQLIDGDPRAREHQSLQWVSPDRLDELDWLHQDRVFLPELRELLLDGDPLPGGATGGATRIGATVRRPTGAWTPAVHGLLAHLSETPGVPTLLGTDARGREVLSYIEGSTVRPDDETISDAQVESCGRMLRTIHQAMSTYRPVGVHTWRYGDRELQPGQVICHNDPGIYNWAFAGDDAVGLFDWDMSGPGDPIDDLAFLAWTAIPLYRDIEPATSGARLRVLAAAYGGVDPASLLEAARRRMSTASDRIAAGIERGDPGMLNLAKVGEPERTRRRLNHLAAYAEQIRSHLPAPSG